MTGPYNLPDESADSTESFDSRNRRTRGRWTFAEVEASASAIESGFKGHGQHCVAREGAHVFSACRDSQVWPTAQRSGRCLVGVRRFKSCSLHFSSQYLEEVA